MTLNKVYPLIKLTTLLNPGYLPTSVPLATLSYPPSPYPTLPYWGELTFAETAQAEMTHAESKIKTQPMHSYSIEKA